MNGVFYKFNRASYKFNCVLYKMNCSADRLLYALCVPLMLIVLLGGQVSAQAQERYPSKSITIVNPGPAGGAIDNPARAIAKGIAEILKEQVITLNLPGAGGTIATARVANAAPDGYTVLFHHIGVATAPAQYAQLPYDTLKDLIPLGLSTEVQMMVVSRNDFLPKTVQELIAYLNANHDKVTVATAGGGSASELCAALLMKHVGKRFTSVPYKGSPPALLDIAAGRVDLICDQTSTSAAQVKAGNVKTYGVASKERLPLLPETPTLSEQGMPFVFSVWQGFYVPAGTPSAIVKKLSRTIEEAVQNEAVQKQLAAYGVMPIAATYRSPESHKQRLEQEIAIWTELYRDVPKQ